MTLNTSAWVEFSEDVLDLERLAPLWRKALIELGFSPSDQPYFRIKNNAPEFNIGLLIETVTQGQMKQDGYELIPIHSKIRATAALLKLQWKIERFLAKEGTLSDPQIRSLGLGICLQLLSLRLPRHSPEQLAKWLMTPTKAPRTARRTVRLLIGIQKTRTALSGCWEPLRRPFEASTSTSPPPRATAEQTLWKGLPVSPGIIQGKYCLIERPGAKAEFRTESKTILIFPKALPKTVEHFPTALALVFCEGGVLSHACTVAREQGIPCVTAVGPTLLDALRTRRPERIEINGTEGSVRV